VPMIATARAARKSVNDSAVPIRSKYGQMR
jgi:hypothetical protein